MKKKYFNTWNLNLAILLTSTSTSQTRDVDVDVDVGSLSLDWGAVSNTKETTHKLAF